MKNNIKSYERCMFNEIKPISATYFLHILQGQASGFHTLISLLNSCKDLQFLIFWGTMVHILGHRSLTHWKLHGDLYFWSVIKMYCWWSTSYFCKKHCVNNLFVGAVQKTFNEATRSAIREYGGYALKFAPDRLKAKRRSLSSIENIIDKVWKLIFKFQ